MATTAEQELEAVRECLVVNYHFNEGAEEFFLTTESWAKAVESARRFVEFRFSGATEFERTFGLNARTNAAGGSYRVGDLEGAYVVQDIDLKEATAARRVTISLGDSFGAVSFSFEKVSAQKLDTTAERKGDDWVYEELGGGTPLDFTNPFGRNHFRDG